MAGHPLRPATRRSLGGPLPHQLADRPRAHPSPPELSTTIRCLRWSYSVLASVSRSYPDVMGRLLTCYSPVRRSCTPKGLTARLACVKHAASVRPEPGSNSPLKSSDVSLSAPHRLFRVSRQELVPRREPSLPKEPSCRHRGTRGPAQPADGAFRTNSSTFGTLLSSQGSSAHRSPASRPRCGATFVNLPVRCWPVNFPGPCSAPLPRAPDDYPTGRRSEPVRSGRARWDVVRGRPPGSSDEGLASRRSLATTRTLRGGSGSVKPTGV